MTGSALSDAFVERPMTLDEWALLDEDEPGEVVDGRLVEEEMTDWIHEELVGALIATLHPWARSRGGRVGGSEAKLAVGRARGRRPDISVYLDGRKPPGRGLIDVPPDIVVEVVSPRPRDGRRDRVEKTLDYAAFGVASYWIVDPQLRTFEVLVRGDDGRYVLALSAAEGRLDAIPGCPGLVVDLDALWSGVDELSR